MVWLFLQSQQSLCKEYNLHCSLYVEMQQHHLLTLDVGSRYWLDIAIVQHWKFAIFV